MDQTKVVRSANTVIETEQTMMALWKEVLQSSELPGMDENFFALGGDSMTMVTLEYRIYEEFSVELPAGIVLGAPTVRDLSAIVDAERSNLGSTPCR